MPAKRIDPYAIKLHRPYSVEEAARALEVHKHSVRNWIKLGLPTVDRSRPVLMHGHELRAYLQGKRKSAKCPCTPGTIYCFKCRQPRVPAFGMLEFTLRNATTGNLTALCEACGTVMNPPRSRYSMASTIRRIGHLRGRPTWHGGGRKGSRISHSPSLKSLGKPGPLRACSFRVVSVHIVDPLSSFAKPSEPTLCRRVKRN